MTEGVTTTEHHGTILQPEAHFPSIGPETVFHIGSWPIANSTLMLIVSGILVIAVTYALRKKLREVPGLFQNICESIYESIEGLLVQLTGDIARSKIILPTLGSVIIFIMLSNFMGHIPLLTSITYKGEPVFRSATADFNTTFALAVGAVLAVQFIGFRENGFGYLGHFFKFKEVYRGFKQGIGAGMIAIVEFFVGLLELIGEFIRIISLSVRLFGNMFAGKVVMAIAIGSFAYVLPALWLGFEFLVAFVQALVFTSLVTVYYTMVLKHDENH
jgi:F-type H+-transporting ATPase subunit a